MGVWSGQYPRELADVIGHAKRLTKVLANLEAQDPDPWFLGRASELRGVVSLALGDWRSGATDLEAACHAIASYIDTLHRAAARKRHGRCAFDCCDVEEVITSGASDEPTDADAALPTNGPTAPARWVDSPEVLARVQEGLPLVDRSARAIARRVGEAHATLDDLSAFGREGLLDAARAFDERHGVPFERWAALRIRNSMIDGVRRWGPVPPRQRRRDQRRDAKPEVPGTATVGPRARPEGSGHASDADSVPLAPDGGPNDAPVGLGEGSRGLGATPEEMFERAQIAALVRAIVADLPDRERVLIERSYFEGLTPEQAAASIGVSRSWAHRVHARAIARVERELRKRNHAATGGVPWIAKRP